MNLLLLVTLLYSAIGCVQGLTDGQLCGRNYPGVFEAIQNFCNPKTDMVVPSPYTDKGGRSSGDDKHWTVSILGTCNPVQWVPQKYCFSQFYSMCNDIPTDATYQSITRNYGNKDCQNWIISNMWFEKRGEAVEVDPVISGDEEAVQ